MSWVSEHTGTGVQSGPSFLPHLPFLLRGRPYRHEGEEDKENSPWATVGGVALRTFVVCRSARPPLRWPAPGFDDLRLCEGTSTPRTSEEGLHGCPRMIRGVLFPEGTRPTLIFDPKLRGGRWGRDVRGVGSTRPGVEG